MNKSLRGVLETSKYEERIRNLLENHELCNKRLHNGKSSRKLSNCHGTALWIMGFKDIILSEFFENKSLDLINNMWDVGFAIDGDRPFYCSERLINWFLSQKSREIKKQKDQLFAIEGILTSLDGHDYDALVHGGIYLGGDKDYVFEQTKQGGEFRITTLEEVKRDYHNNPKFYKAISSS